MKVNFQEVILNAISSKFSGRLIFIGPEGGVVRVVFIEGKIKEVDSTWGYGSNELEKLKLWGEGNVITKELNQKEIEKYKASPTIEYKFTCPNCGNEIPLITNFCPECGYQIRNVKICSNCGFENPPNAKFCEKCGNKFYTEQITKNVKICPNCSSAISQNAKFCPECGYNFIKICPECKSENLVDAKFCEECGYVFKKEKNFPFLKIFTLVSIFFIIIALLTIIPLSKRRSSEVVLQAPGVIQEFITSNQGTKVETLNIVPKKLEEPQESKKIVSNIKSEKREEVQVNNAVENLTCNENSYTYRNLKLDGISFEITQDKKLNYYKYGPMNLTNYDTLKVNIEIIAGLLRSKEAILFVVSLKNIEYIENLSLYKVQDLNNFDNFVKSGFNLPFKKAYITSKGSIFFNPNNSDEYYLVIINPPYIEKEGNKTYIKSRPLFFNLYIILKTCKKSGLKL